MRHRKPFWKHLVYTTFECSECGRIVRGTPPDTCPHCLADMVHDRDVRTPDIKINNPPLRHNNTASSRIRKANIVAFLNSGEEAAELPRMNASVCNDKTAYDRYIGILRLEKTVTVKSVEDKIIIRRLENASKQ